jgi:hypothetical protein
MITNVRYVRREVGGGRRNVCKERERMSGEIATFYTSKPNV